MLEKTKPHGFPRGFAKEIKPIADCDGLEEIGGAGRDRTDDLYNAIGL